MFLPIILHYLHLSLIGCYFETDNLSGLFELSLELGLFYYFFNDESISSSFLTVFYGNKFI
jgi:hypothetical protein